MIESASLAHIPHRLPLREGDSTVKKVLLLVSILCLSLSAFGQQNKQPQPQQKRTNYIFYEIGDAGTDNLILIVTNARLNILLLDDDNFQKYKNGVDNRQLSYGVLAQMAANPTYISPQKGHWHLIIDNGGQPLGNVGVRLYLAKELPQEKPK